MPSPIQQKINTRLLLTQVVYQHRVRGQALPLVAQEYALHHIAPKPHHYDRPFYDVMMAYLTDNTSAVAQTLGQYETDAWRYERMDLVLMGILMVGTAELLCQPQTPTSVILNEYIELTKDFLTDKDAKFVHVILDKVAAGRG
jgi:transcription antitermination factor NusB